MTFSKNRPMCQGRVRSTAARGRWLENVTLMCLGRLSDLVFETASMNLSAAALLPLVVVTSSPSAPVSWQQSFSSINASCMTTCNVWQQYTSIVVCLGVGGHVGRHIGLASDLMVQCHFLWPQCVPCPRKHRDRHQVHQFWVDSYRLMAIRRFRRPSWTPSWKKNFSGAPILVNF